MEKNISPRPRPAEGNAAYNRRRGDIRTRDGPPQPVPGAAGHQRLARHVTRWPTRCPPRTATKGRLRGTGLDVETRLRYGRRGDKTRARPTTLPARDRRSLVWETDAATILEAVQRGQGGPNGFLPLFIQDTNPAKTTMRYHRRAGRLDARAVQRRSGANTWATQQTHGKGRRRRATRGQGRQAGVTTLRYSCTTEYFKQVGNCVGPPTCHAGNG